MNEETSELVCLSCGAVKGLVGIAFNEAQLFSQEGQNRKLSRAQKMNATWNICLDCSVEMVVDEETSELVCQSRAKVKGLVCIAFNEEGESRKPSRSEAMYSNSPEYRVKSGKFTGKLAKDIKK